MKIKDKVLIVEDEQSISNFISMILTANGFDTIIVRTGEEALTMIASHCPDMIVLDLGLPDMDGMEVLKSVRKWSNLPVVVVSARSHEHDKVQALDLGADDYLTKPFALPELEVRLEALMARVHGRQRRKILEVHDLKLDLATLEATRAGQPLHLYPACRKLLETLMQASPAAVTRQQLEHALWGDHPPDGDMLRSHIYELRRSVDGPFPVKLIQTLPRTGYRLAVPHASGDA